MILVASCTHPFVGKQTCFNMQGMPFNILCGERDATRFDTTTKQYKASFVLAVICVQKYTEYVFFCMLGCSFFYSIDLIFYRSLCSEQTASCT